MLDLLEKFEKVEIKNDSRLGDEDKKYCDRQYTLYIKVLNHYRNMFKLLQNVNQQDNDFYKSVSVENDYYSGTYKHQIYMHEFMKVNKEDFSGIMEETHNRFIERINKYFINKYNVTLKEKKFKDYVQLEKPESPSSYGYRNMTEEEIEQCKIKKEEYKAAFDIYLNNKINAELHYDPIVDDIFISLGGFNFAEKAENEIKENAQNAVKGYRDNEPKYEIKNGKISFDIMFSRKCSIWNQYRIDLSSESYHAVLRALTYFDSDNTETAIYDKWIGRFTGYEKKEEEGIYDSHYANGVKIHYFKYYKNGKFDVTFDNHTNALTFAREFLEYSA